MGADKAIIYNSVADTLSAVGNEATLKLVGYVMIMAEGYTMMWWS